MADGFDFFFSPTGPSWLPDRSPKGARRGRDGETDPRATTPVFRNARSWRGPESEPAADPERTEEPQVSWESLPSDEERSADASTRVERDGDLPRGPQLDDELTPSALPGAARPAPMSIEQATGLLRDVAVPALRAAVSQLLARGHEVSLRDALDSADPRLVVLFLPNEGPLRRIGAPDPSLAGFEMRIGGAKHDALHDAGRGPSDRRANLPDRTANLSDAGVRAPDPGGAPSGPQVVARHSAGPGSGGFLTLGRTSAAGLTPDWVTGRFVEFVQLTLERALDTT